MHWGKGVAIRWIIVADGVVVGSIADNDVSARHIRIDAIVAIAGRMVVLNAVFRAGVARQDAIVSVETGMVVFQHIVVTAGLNANIVAIGHAVFDCAASLDPNAVGVGVGNALNNLSVASEKKSTYKVRIRGAFADRESVLQKNSGG